jgi:hypothetical protein
MIRSPRSAAVALAILLTVSACDQKKQPGNTIDAIDNQLVDGSPTSENSAAGLGAKIKVDPAKTGAKAGATPARSQAADADNCLGRYGSTLAYANDWADKLPPGFPLPPQARLTEAAGHDGGCSIRAASFTLPGARTAALDWYAAKAQAAGYSADRDDQGGDLRLAGSKDDAAFYVIAGAPVAGATPIDFIWAKSE